MVLLPLTVATHLQVVRRNHSNVFGSEAGVRQGLDVQLHDVDLACGEQTCSFTAVHAVSFRWCAGGRDSPWLPLDCSSGISISSRPQPAVSMSNSGVLVSSTAVTPGRSLQRRSKPVFVCLCSSFRDNKTFVSDFGCSLTSTSDFQRSCEPSASPGTSAPRPTP